MYQRYGGIGAERLRAGESGALALEFNGQLAVERYRESHPSYWQQGGAATGAPWCAGFALTYNPATVASNASVNTQSSLLGEQGVTCCERQHPD